MSEAARALFQEAVQAHQAGDLTAAERLYRQTIAADPRSLSARGNLAVVAFQRGDPAAGVAWLDQSLALEPNQPGALANRANARAHLGQLDLALADADAALAFDPAQLEALNHRAVILERMERWSEAADAYGAVLAAQPGSALAACNQAAMLHRTKRLDEALTLADRALALDPALAKAWCSRGALQAELGRNEEGAEDLRRSLELDPSDAEAWYNLGSILARLRRTGAALDAFDRACALRPGFHAAAWNKSLVLLAAGRFAEGWPLYEKRWDTADYWNALKISPAPVWRGVEDISGKTLLVHFEQGLGDTLQMMRYLPLLKARGARVILAAQPQLAPLYGQLGERALKLGEPFPPHDLKTFTMCLPLAFGGLIPGETPYLTAPSEASARWTDRLGPRTRRRIGLVWSGNPGHVNDHNRSLALQTLLPVLDADADFHSLHAEYRPADRAVVGAEPRLTDHAHYLTDFGETAGLIDNLDLVITVDTAVAHLAGALGKPVWLMLPYVVDWRWRWEGETTPWYPNMRLFRQPAVGEWPDVVRQVEAALS
jgi:tetratricopeptide (TPR) repeat protein